MNWTVLIVVAMICLTAMIVTSQVTLTWERVRKLEGEYRYTEKLVNRN